MVILDTDCMSLLQRESPAARLLEERLESVGYIEITTTIITFEEQMRGWLAYAAKARSLEQQVAAYTRLGSFLENYREVTVLPFEQVAAIEFRRLQSLKVRIGTMDLKIASIALANEALLITRNIADFEQVPSLRFADWTKS